MCLAIPMEIVKIEGASAVAASRGVETKVNIMLAPEEIHVGDKVLVHAGFIIEKLDPDAALEIEETWQEYMESIEKDEAGKLNI